MRKRINTLMVILCAAFAIALAAAGNVQAKEANPFVVSAPVTKPGKVSAAGKIKVHMRIRKMYSNAVELDFDREENYDVQLFNFKKKKIATYHCRTGCWISLSKNRVYYIRFRANSDKWSKMGAMCTVTPKLSLKKGPKVIFKMPKPKRVKKFYMYMSTSYGSGYKKIKTVKPKKSITIRRFKGSKLTFYKPYYYRFVAVLKGGKKAVCPTEGNFYLYKKYY